MFRLLCIPLLAGILTASTLTTIADDSLKPPKITDPKLGSMRYGGESIVYWIEKMKEGDKSRAQQLRRDLGKLRERMNRIKGADATQAKTLNNYFLKIERAIAEKSSGSIKPPADPAATAIGPATPNGKMSSDEAHEFIKACQAKYANGGTVALPEIRRLLNDNRLTEAEVDRVLSDLAVYQAEVAKDLPILKEAVAISGTGEYWLRWIGGEAMKSYQQEIRVLKSSLDNHITRAAKDADYKSRLDIETHHFQFRGSAAIKALDRFETAIKMIDQATRLEEAFDLKGTWSDLKPSLTKNTETFRRLVERVDSGQSTRLPKEVPNPELRKIAERTLQKRKYGVGKWERLIVNSKRVPRERIEHKVFAGRLETVVREWEEFQVTTVEQDEKGKYYLYHNMVAKFSRAPQTTPINEWILTKRFKGNAIAKANLQSP